MKYSLLPRVHINDNIAKRQMIIVKNEEFYYLKTVLRMRVLEKFRLFNSVNGEFLVTIKEINRNNIVIKVDELIRKVFCEKNLTLAICIIKQDRMIEAIKAAIQLGVTGIIPIISDRTQHKKINRDKINKCIIQSVEQSERFIIPKINSEIKLTDFCMEFQDKQIIFACESEYEMNKINKIREISEDPYILIGSEGGFSDDEVKMLKNMKNTYSVSLGHTVLRSETAAINALSCITMIRGNE